MPKEYPKMLYSGDKEQYSCRIVHDAEEEQQFREIGLMDYVDLPEHEPTVGENTGAAEGGGMSEIPQGFVTTEQFDAVAERLAIAEAEIKQMHEVINAPTQDFAPEMQDLSAVSEMSSEPKADTNYNSLTKEELQALIIEQGKTFKSADTKAELIAILEG